MRRRILAIMIIIVFMIVLKLQASSIDFENVPVRHTPASQVNKVEKGRENEQSAACEVIDIEKGIVKSTDGDLYYIDTAIIAEEECAAGDYVYMVYMSRELGNDGIYTARYRMVYKMDLTIHDD